MARPKETLETSDQRPPKRLQGHIINSSSSNMNSEDLVNQIIKEHHRVFATIEIETPENEGIKTRRVEGVLCKVFLPFKKTDRPLLHFLPNNEQESRLQASGLLRMEGEVVQPNGTRTVITAKRVHIVSHTSDPWGPGQIDHLLIGEPWDLEINHIHSASDRVRELKTVGTFCLSPNQLISNIRQRTSSRTSFSIKKLAPLTITLPNGLEVAFELLMGHRDERGGQTVIFDEMAAEFTLPFDARDTATIHDAMKQLEDVLRLVSFVGEWRCACVGWQAVDSKGLTEFYRPRKVPNRKPPSVHDALIQYQYFSEFLDSSSKNLGNLPSSVALGRAIDYVIPDENKTLESSYIMLYAAVETLVSVFRKQEGIESIFENESAWALLQADLRQWLKSHPVLSGNGEKRNLVYGKLPELTRPAFSFALDKFCNRYGIDLSDLWPMTGRKDGDSLSEIRNKLVHGEVFSADRYRALMAAREHLRWSVYRMIFGVVGWPIAKTKIDPKGLAGSPVYRSWIQDRTTLSKEL